MQALIYKHDQGFAEKPVVHNLIDSLYFYLNC